MESAMTQRKDGYGWGIRLLTAIGGSAFVERFKLHQPSLRLLKGGTRLGFRAAGAVSRPFKAVRKLMQPQRPGRPAATDLFDLTPTDEQRMIRETMQQFAGERLRPLAASADGACAAPAELLKEAGELGIALMTVPEELGGAAAERSPVTGALIAEALAHGDMGLAVACLAPAGAAAALAEWGDAEQQAAYLASFAGDNAPPAAIAVLEDRPLFDARAPATTARRENGGFVLSGEKALVPLGATAELLLVAAREEDGKTGLFIVESGSKGLTQRAEPGMGLRAASLARLHFDRVKLPAGARLGGAEGMDYPAFLNLSRLAWCALAVGTAQAVLDYAIPYANERQAFGEPIGHRQGVAFMIANLAIELDGMRLATWRAASLAAHGQDCTREAALARELCARHGMRIGSDGVQLLGGHGFVKEHPVERWYRDLRAVAVMEGGVMV